LQGTDTSGGLRRSKYDELQEPGLEPAATNLHFQPGQRPDLDFQFRPVHPGITVEQLLGWYLISLVRVVEHLEIRVPVVEGREGCVQPVLEPAGLENPPPPNAETLGR